MGRVRRFWKWRKWFLRGSRIENSIIQAIILTAGIRKCSVFTQQGFAGLKLLDYLVLDTFKIKFLAHNKTVLAKLIIYFFADTV